MDKKNNRRKKTNMIKTMIVSMTNNQIVSSIRSLIDCWWDSGTGTPEGVHDADLEVGD